MPETDADTAYRRLDILNSVGWGGGRWYGGHMPTWTTYSCPITSQLIGPNTRRANNMQCFQLGESLGSWILGEKRITQDQPTPEQWFWPFLRFTSMTQATMFVGISLTYNREPPLHIRPALLLVLCTKANIFKPIWCFRVKEEAAANFLIGKFFFFEYGALLMWNFKSVPKCMFDEIMFKNSPLKENLFGCCTQII